MKRYVVFKRRATGKLTLGWPGVENTPVAIVEIDRGNRWTADNIAKYEIAIRRGEWLHCQLESELTTIQRREYGSLLDSLPVYKGEK